MAFWFAFFMWLGTSILSALLAKPKIEGQRPSGLDDFQVPTATEGRAVPICVGMVKMAGPNVAWYGDLKTVAIKEKVGGFLGIGGKNVTKAYKYHVGVQMVICSGPIGGVKRVWMGDKEIYSGAETSGNIVVLDDELFGGEEKGGGVDFTLEQLIGTDDQATNAYLASQLTLTPRYQNVAYFMLSDGAGGPGYIGNTAQLRNLAFEVFWYPNSLTVTGGKERIGDDANPICFLYELLVNNDDWGIEMPSGDVLVAGTAADGALRALAEQVADEGLGFSMVIDRPMTAAELIKEIERHVDGKFRLDLTDGQFKIILARPPAGSVPLLDETNITKFVNYSRPTWTETFNEVRISYADRAKDYDSTFAFDQDLANLDITGRKRQHTMAFPGVKTGSVAAAMAAREMFTLGSPVARAQVQTSAKMYALQIGDPVDLSWAAHEIVELPMRINRIKYGKDSEAEMTVDLVEDAFRLETQGMATPPPSLWVPPNVDAVNPLDARLWNPPSQLAVSDIIPVLLVSRDGGLHLSYDIYTDVNGGTDNFVITNSAQSSWVPVASLLGAHDADLNGPPHYDGTIVIDGLNDISSGELIALANATLDSNDPGNLILVDDELIWFEGVTDNMDGSFDLTTAHRGVFGTIPVDHADDARVWFVGLGGDLLYPSDDTTTSLGSSIRCRVLTRTATGTLAIGSANNIPVAADFARAAGAIPYAPSDMQANTELFVDDNWTKTPGTLRVTWNNRNRQADVFGAEQETAGAGLPALQAVSLEVKRVDTDAVVADQGFATQEEFNASEFLIVTTEGEVIDQGGTFGTGGVIAELDHYVEAKATQFGRDSQLWRSPNFEVFGFGLDLGGDFGGQDTGGANTGTVLNQGAAPKIVEPVPAAEISNRVYQFKVINDPVSTDDVRVLFNVYDGNQFEMVNFDYEISGTTFPTANDVAQEILDRFNEFLADRAFTITKSGTTVEVRGVAGSVVNFQTRYPAGGNHFQFARPWLDEEARGTATAARGAYYVDWWTTEFDPSIGRSVDILSPTNDAAFQNTGFYQVVFQLIGLTRDARRRVAESPNSGSVRAVGSMVVDNDVYSREFTDIAQKIQDGGWADLVSASTGRITTNPAGSEEQVRSAVTIQPDFDIAIREQFFESHSFGSPPGIYKLLLKENNPINPVIGGPLAQASIYGYPAPYNHVLTGYVLSAVVNNSEFSRTVASPGDQDALNTAVAGLVDDVNAGSEPVTASLESFRGYDRMVVAHNNPGITATFFAYTWVGLSTNRIEYRIIDE